MTKDKLKRKLRKLRTRTKLEISDLLIERDQLTYNLRFSEIENDRLQDTIEDLKEQIARLVPTPTTTTISEIATNIETNN